MKYTSTLAVHVYYENIQGVLVSLCTWSMGIWFGLFLRNFKYWTVRSNVCTVLSMHELLQEMGKICHGWVKSFLGKHK